MVRRLAFSPISWSNSLCRDQVWCKVPSRCSSVAQQRRQFTLCLISRTQIPNYLTYSRVAAIPALAAIGLAPAFIGQCTLTALIFAIASITDLLDGYLARRWGCISAMGIFLDPVADKLIVAVALIILSARFPTIPVLLSACTIVAREIFISALREWMAIRRKSAVVKVSPLGKVKTAIQMISICALLSSPLPNTPFAIGATSLLAFSAFLTILSAANYVRAAVRALSQSDGES